MKIKYKGIVGTSVIEKCPGSCKCCCFNLDVLICVPYKVLRCEGTICEESKSQVFEI